MKNLAKILLLLPLSAGAAPANEWLEQVPPSAGAWRNWTTIESFFEVPASKLAAAEVWLADIRFLAQDQGGLLYFGRPDLKCLAPARPYLVRAQYVNGGTGRFDLMWTQDGALVVAHASLGPGGPVTKSAIVACLPAEPKAVYSSISGAI